MYGVEVASGVVSANGTALTSFVSEPHATNRSDTKSAKTNESALVLVARVIVLCVVMTAVVLAVIAVIVPGMVVPSVRIESRRRRWRSCLLVTVRVIDVSVRVSRVIVAERDTFEITRRARNSIGLTERNVVRRLAFKDEICRLGGRK